MKTEKEIRARLRSAKKTLRETERRFKQYDNIDDMHAAEEYRMVVGELEWVLKEGD